MRTLKTFYLNFLPQFFSWPGILRFSHFFLEIPFNVFNDYVKFHFWILLFIGARAYNHNFSTFFKKNSTTVVFTVRKVVFCKKYPKIKYPTSKLLTWNFKWSLNTLPWISTKINVVKRIHASFDLQGVPHHIGSLLALNYDFRD